MNITLLRVLRPYRRAISSRVRSLKEFGPYSLRGIVLDGPYVVFEYGDQWDTYTMRAHRSVAEPARGI